LFERHGLVMPIEVVPSTLRREVLEAGARGPRLGVDGPLRVLFVGQVGRRKGVPELLDGMKRVRDRGRVARLTIVGPSEQPGELEAARAQTTRLGLDGDVEFTGPLTGEALYERYRAHHILALPSHTEGLPVVLLEAAAFRLAVLTTPVGSIPDLIHDGENGVLVPPGDPDAIAAGLERLAEPAWREALVERLTAALAAYHPDRIASRVADAVRTELAARDAAIGRRPGAA
jgi:glycosyltransferase involved in cell wall biosynthesis